MELRWGKSSRPRFFEAILRRLSRSFVVCRTMRQYFFIKRLIAGFTPYTRAEVYEAIKGLRTNARLQTCRSAVRVLML